MDRSPFPGMDPFLEDPGGWPDVHLRLLASISELIADVVSPNYLVRVEERVYLANPGDPSSVLRVPDVLVVAAGRRLSSTGAAGATITAPVHFDVLEDTVRDRYLVIRDRLHRRVVTVIEVLSPSNKVRGSDGFRALTQKRDELRDGGAHWLEIDLLRGGERHLAVASGSPYAVVRYRAGTLGVDVWFVGLRDQLPVVGVPLLDPDPDVGLDLQQALNLAYQRAHYGDSVDYNLPVPPPALSRDDAEWVAERVRDRELTSPPGG